jgi:hypothetical protein
MSDDEVRIPFDPDTESLYCSRDGIKLEKSGHMFSEFLLCPRHGEFTIAPVVIREPEKVVQMMPPFEVVPNTSPDAGKWFMVGDDTLRGMWETCKVVDARHDDGSDYDPRETRVI